MALVKCKECGKEISSKASSCPNCGFVIKKKGTSYSYLWVIILVALILIIIGSLSQSDSSISSITTEKVTLEQFQKIEVGMSYQEVVQIIGSEGEEISRNKIEGIPGVMDLIETVMYQWINVDGSNMNAIFQNDKLFQKSQFGLK